MPSLNGSTTSPSTSSVCSVSAKPGSTFEEGQESPALRPCQGSDRADDDDVARLRTLRAILDLVLHLRALRETLVPLTFDRAVMDEDVLASISRGDEAVPLLAVEPLHGSGCHIDTSPNRVRNAQRKGSQAKTGTRSNARRHLDSTSGSDRP